MRIDSIGSNDSIIPIADRDNGDIKWVIESFEPIESIESIESFESIKLNL